jgi:geranylgeranyl diphosphate synthase type I
LNRKNVREEIKDHREEVSEFLDSYLEEWDEIEPDASRWRSDLKERMNEMVKGGKMVRGSLVLKTCEMYNGGLSEEAVKVAGAIELLHTGLLMHDDIIDRDDYRRGMPTFKKQYEELAAEERVDEEEHFGTGMAITAGDVAFFMGQGLLARLETDPEIRRKITELVFSEFSAVGLAEQVDIYSGYSRNEVSEEEIMRLYRDKTARYTFSLPLKAGALLSGVKEEEIERLYRLGEKIGIVFQLRDDELGLFGSEEETGKTLGSDLDENKKTPLRLRLLEKLPEEEAEDLKERLRGDLSQEDKEEIRDLMEEKGVRDEVGEMMERYASEARGDVEELEAPEEFKEFLNGMIDFCLYRES